MAKQNGMATLLAIGLIVGALGVGYYFKHYTDSIDHPIEQTVEKILKDHGIEHDFSEDKKQAQQSRG